MEQFFATCPRGLEQVLVAELAALGASEPAADDGGVGFTGELAVACLANLESRIASRILWRIGHAPYRTEHDVHDAARGLPWQRYFDVRRTIRVDTAAVRSPLKSRDFVTLLVKDAVCDAFRAAQGSRPDVDTTAPDVRIQVFLTRDAATFYLDTSGEPLFRRGWRAVRGEAPLRENLAAGILKLADWVAPTPLYDPMCGSGTFLVEAAMMSLDIAPGLNRAFAFEKLEGFDLAGWRTVKEKAGARRRPASALPIFGSERSGTALGLARENLASAGMAEAVRLKQVTMLDASPPADAGILVMNPPYGERMGDDAELAAFYPKLGDVLKQRFTGWTAYIFTADLRLPKLIRLAAARRIPLYNAALECRLFKYELVAGSRRREKK